MKKLLIILTIIFISCGSAEDEIASLEKEVETISNESEETSSIIGEVVEDDSFDDFTRYIDVEGLRIFALPEVSSEFIPKVAEVYHLMFEENEYIDQTMRSRYLKTLKENFVFQRVGYVGPEYYMLDSNSPNVDCCPGKQYEDNHTDYIWEYPDANTDRQINEVIEHLLHTVTTVAFALVFPEWDWENPNSDIRLATNEAIEKNIYDISSYEEILNRGDIEGFNRVTSQEFAYWVIVTEWGYDDICNLPNGEFSISSASELKAKLPLAHKLYVNTVQKILTPPDKNYLKSMF